MPKQSEPQKETVGRVMHEFKHGELSSSTGKKVRSRKQAVAIALSEAGSSNQESPKTNARNLRRTKSKERHGRTAQAEKEGKAAQDRTLGGGPTKAELYAKAKRQGIAGRSKMSKAELARAVKA
jgi:hypothetical protein